MEDVSREAAAEPGLRRRVVAWLLPIVYYGAIVIQSSFVFQTPDTHIPYVDKLAHFVIYGVLGLLIARAVIRSASRQPAALLTVALATAAVGCLGALDEVHQYFVPGRSADVFDGLADVVGAVVGSSCFALGSRRGRRSDGR